MKHLHTKKQRYLKRGRGTPPPLPPQILPQPQHTEPPRQPIDEPRITRPNTTTMATNNKASGIIIGPPFASILHNDSDCVATSAAACVAVEAVSICRKKIVIKKLLFKIYCKKIKLIYNKGSRIVNVVKLFIIHLLHCHNLTHCFFHSFAASIKENNISLSIFCKVFNGFSPHAK